MARRRLKKKFKKKINRAVRRFSALTMALILMVVLLSLESFSVHAEEIEDASADTLTIVELGETESIVTEETTDVISDGTEGSESESGDVVEGESGEAIEDESEEISEELSEEVSEEISEEVSEDESEEISEDISGEISEDELEELSEEASEEISEEVSEETSEKGKEKKSKDDKKKEKDSKDKKKKETVTYEVGDIITFGQYEQDGNEDNGPEDIEWVVLSVDDEKALVVSKYALDCRPYNIENADVTWENCSLRTWLNNDFLNSAFSDEEQDHIPEVTIANEDNSYYGTWGGNNTTDRVFCLSLNEINDYIGYSSYDDMYQYGYNLSLIVEPTQRAIDNGASVYTISELIYNDYLLDVGYSSDVIGLQGVSWWLRSPGCEENRACYVYGDGGAGANYRDRVDNSYKGVRPALFLNCLVDLEKDNELTEEKEKIDSLENIVGETDLGDGLEREDVEDEESIVIPKDEIITEELSNECGEDSDIENSDEEDADSDEDRDEIEELSDFKNNDFVDDIENVIEEMTEKDKDVSTEDGDNESQSSNDIFTEVIFKEEELTDNTGLGEQ